MRGPAHALFGRDRQTRFSGLVHAYANEWSANEEDECPESVLAILRKIAFLQCSLEDIEQEYVLSGGYPRARAEYVKLAGQQTKLLRSVGLMPSHIPDVEADPDLDDEENEIERNFRWRRAEERKPSAEMKAKMARASRKAHLRKRLRIRPIADRHTRERLEGPED